MPTHRRIAACMSRLLSTIGGSSLVIFTIVSLSLGGCAGALSWDGPASGTQSGNSKKQSRQNSRLISKRKPGSYRVQPGDTIYSIAYKNELDYRKLAAWNGKSNGYLIFVGEVLTLSPPSGYKRPAKQQQPANSPRIASRNGQKSTNISVLSQGSAQPNWLWPISNPVLAQNQSAAGKIKGLLLKGKSGQVVRASATGRVVYVKVGLPRYGELMIVQHNENFFSAYAHLENISVKQGELVRAGQAIATIGTVPGENKRALRFDLRSAETSLDLLKVLPPIRN